MSPAIGYSETMLEDAADRGQHDLMPDLERIHAAAQRFLALIDDVVHVATTDAAAMTRELDSAGMPAMIQDVVSTMSALGEDAGATAQTDRGAVLVVDDNAINRDMLWRRLEREGHTGAVA